MHKRTRSRPEGSAIISSYSRSIYIAISSITAFHGIESVCWTLFEYAIWNYKWSRLVPTQPHILRLTHHPSSVLSHYIVYLDSVRGEQQLNKLADQVILHWDSFNDFMRGFLPHSSWSLPCDLWLFLIACALNGVMFMHTSAPVTVHWKFMFCTRKTGRCMHSKEIIVSCKRKLLERIMMNLKGAWDTKL